MGALIPGVLLLGFLLFAAGKKKGTSGAGAPPAGGGPVETPWKLVTVKEANGEVFIDVFAKQGAFGPHQEMRVLRYKETPEGRRVLITETPGVPPEITAAAREQFGLIQAPADFSQA